MPTTRDSVVNRLRRRQWLAAAALACLATTASAALVDRGSGLIYDTELNVTWFQDANYAKTSGFHATGAMPKKQALAWVAGLAVADTVRGTTLTGWRLPKTGPINGVSHELFGVGVDGWGLYNGSSDVGVWISAPGSAFAGSKANELARLHYYTLRNRGQCGSPGQISNNFCTINFPDANFGFNWGGLPYIYNSGPFVNIAPAEYWGGDLPKPRTIYVDKDSFAFHMSDGSQYARGDKELKYAWAVRDGDVTTPNPAPPVSATTLSVKTSGGKALISGAGGLINCGTLCIAALPEGTVVTLTAAPETGLRFVNWSGACTGTTPTCVVQVFGRTQVQANVTR